MSRLGLYKDYHDIPSNIHFRYFDDQKVWNQVQIRRKNFLNYAQLSGWKTSSNIVRFCTILVNFIQKEINYMIKYLKSWIALCLKSSIVILIIRIQQSYYHNECGHDVSKPNRETIQNSNFMKVQLKVWIRSSRVIFKLI